jgi:hypothetical protein
MAKTGLDKIDRNHLPQEEYNQLLNKGYMIIADDLTPNQVEDYKRKNRAGTKAIFVTNAGQQVETIITNCEVNLIREGYYKGSIFVTIE